MQFYLLPYIWCIFLMATIPIINFRGIVHTENERSFVWIVRQFRIFKLCIQYTVRNIRTLVREHTFVGGGTSAAVKCWGVSNSHSRQKAATKGAARELHLDGRRSCKTPAKELQMAAAFRFIRGATKKLQMWALRSRNLTLKVKFF